MLVPADLCKDTTVAFNRTWCSCISRRHYNYLSWAVDLPEFHGHSHDDPSPNATASPEESTAQHQPSRKSPLPTSLYSPSDPEHHDYYSRCWSHILQEAGVGEELLFRLFVQRPSPKHEFVFGASLGEGPAGSYKASIVHDITLEVPLVVYNCIECLVYSRLHDKSLFSPSEDHCWDRLDELVSTYDSAFSFYGRDLDLTKESTTDICALLWDYINSLPDPVVPKPLRDVLLFVSLQETSEDTRIEATRDFLRLMPFHRFGTFFHLCTAFYRLSHYSATSESRNTMVQRIAAIFSKGIFGGADEQATALLAWVIDYWPWISQFILLQFPDYDRFTDTLRYPVRPLPGTYYVSESSAEFKQMVERIARAPDQQR